MEFNWQVSATNAKGDFVNEVFVCGEEADKRHKELYDEVDSQGLYLWGTIRTINLKHLRDDKISGLFGTREAV